MLLRTIDSVARLRLPGFLSVWSSSNNTPDPAFWEPIERRCRELGPALQVLSASRNLEGFKAAALRLAMGAGPLPMPRSSASSDAELMWLIRNGSRIWSLASPTRRSGLIQAPQDHRDGCRSSIHAAMNAEYAGFFSISAWSSATR